MCSNDRRLSALEKTEAVERLELNQISSDIAEIKQDVREMRDETRPPGMTQGQRNYMKQLEEDLERARCALRGGGTSCQ